MPGAKPDEIKVHLEDGNVLMVSGERQRDKEREHKVGAKYVRMECRQGKFLKRFELPENANTESIVANYQNGVLTVTVEKHPPPGPKKPKLIEIQVGGTGGADGASSGSIQVDGGALVAVQCKSTVVLVLMIRLGDGRKPYTRAQGLREIRMPGPISKKMLNAGC